MAVLKEQESAGLVETRTARIALPPEGFALDCGAHLPELTVAYETYGTLRRDAPNAVLICHALSGDAHVAGYHGKPGEKPGWWDEMVGPGKGIDTNRFFVICSNILGGCKGTTGPASLDPRTGRPYGSTFPSITVGDLVRVQHALLEHLGVHRLWAVVGGSLGGMQVLEWSVQFPDAVERCICIASAASLSTQALAFDVVGREAILGDPGWSQGDFYGTGRGPDAGLALARKIGHITYLSPEIMTRKFGREKKPHDPAAAERFRTRFQVESYLQHQGEKFVARFDANSYLHITEAMDEYDLAEQHGGLREAFARVRSRYLVVALSSDWLFPPEQSLEIATALLENGTPLSYCMLRAPHGHDAFLVDIERLAELVRTFLGEPGGAQAALPDSGPAARDHRLILDMIPPGARVLDLGCGDGTLLARIRAEKQASVLGIDIDLSNVIAAVGRGLNVFQGDIDEGLAMLADQSFDVAVLSQTIQVVRQPRQVLGEMLRVAREGIVSFPNFGNWANRLRLGLRGRMPKSSALPFEWYETPNIHHTTLRDFADLCAQDGMDVRQCLPLAEDRLSCALLHLGLGNLGADRVLVRIGRRRDG